MPISVVPLHLNQIAIRDTYSHLQVITAESYGPFFFNLKSETLVMFKKFKSLVEKEYANVICCLQTDRGGEFTSFDFNEYCNSNGIVRQLAAAYTP